MKIGYAFEAQVYEWRPMEGYGFANSELTDGPLFIHAKQVTNALPKPGQRVRLTSATCGPLGWRAVGPVDTLED